MFCRDYILPYLNVPFFLSFSFLTRIWRFILRYYYYSYIVCVGYEDIMFLGELEDHQKFGM